MVAPVGPKRYPPLEAVDYLRGGAVMLWVALCSLALSVAARSAGCDPPGPLGQAVDQLWASPKSCPGLELAGESVVLVPAIRDGLPLGLLANSSGPVGQIMGLALVALALIMAIVVIRWRWRTPGDAMALGGLWGGLLVHAAPRLLGPGHTFTDLFVMGLRLSVADVAIVYCGGWLLWRLVAELRA